MKRCRDEDPFLRSAAIQALSTRVESISTDRKLNLSNGDLVSLLLAERKADPKNELAADFFFNLPSTEVRLEAMRWIADSEMTNFLPRIQQLLVESDGDFQLFEAALATLNALHGTPELGVSDPKMLISLVQDPETSPRIRAFALRLLDPNAAEILSEVMARANANG